MVTGILKWEFLNKDSKSEGRMALLTTANGEQYKLYRVDHLPVEDDFFAEYDQQQVEVEGQIETRTGYLCVSEIRVIKMSKKNETSEQVSDLKNEEQ